MNNCISRPETVSKFLRLTKGNWRNAIYIACDVCIYEPHEGCTDYLCVTDEQGSPVLLPVSDCREIFSRSIDSGECVMRISHRKFLTLYAAWCEQNSRGLNWCPFRTNK